MMESLVIGVTEARIDDAQMIGLMNRSSDLYKLLNRNEADEVDLGDSCSASLYSRRQKLALIRSINVETFSQNGDVVARVAYDSKAIEDNKLQSAVLAEAQVEILKTVKRALPATYKVSTTSISDNLSYKVELPKTKTEIKCIKVFGARINCRTQITPLPKNLMNLQAARAIQLLKNRNISGSVQINLSTKLHLMRTLEFERGGVSSTPR